MERGALILVWAATTLSLPAHAAEPSASTRDYEAAIAGEPCPDGSARPQGGACLAETATPSNIAGASSVAGAPPCESGSPRLRDGSCPPASVVTEQIAVNPLADSRSTRAGDRPLIVKASYSVNTNYTPVAHSPLLRDLTVTFKPGSATVNEHGLEELSKFADAMVERQFSTRRFEIAGHTDKSGSADRNLALSQARADAVLKFLVAHGVENDRLMAKGYGFARLAFPNAPFDGRNRRVELVSLN